MNLRAAGCTAMLAAGLLMTAPVTASPARTPLAAAADSGGPCDPTVPSAFGSPADNAELRLRATILVDRVPDQRARAIAANVVATYGKIGVRIEHSLRKVPPLRDTEAAHALEHARRFHAPATTDVTHLLTTQDLAYNGDTTLVGYADCIGGLEGHDRAVSVSEVTAKLDDARLLYRYGAGVGDAAANVASHEIGHLLGARHEHADCAAGAPPAAATDPEDVATTCSVMFAAAPTSGAFGIVERVVVRGYVAAYAG